MQLIQVSSDGGEETRCVAPGSTPGTVKSSRNALASSSGVPNTSQKQGERVGPYHTRQQDSGGVSCPVA